LGQIDKTKISGVVIAFNDAPNIRKCLESLHWVDELVVIDSHSTDGTTKICQEFTPHVFHYPFQGFGALRNQALTHASHDWVFSLDTDERSTPEVQEEIERLLEYTPSAHAYKIPRRNYFLGRWIRHCGWYPDYRQPQLFHKKHMRYREDLVHEGYELKGTMGYLHASIEQIPFRDIDQFIRKMDRYTDLRAQAMHREGRTFHPHQLISHPVFTFLKMYLLRVGFLDRKPGLILSILYAYYTFVKYAKLWELQKNGSPLHPMRQQESPDGPS
jgi:glycosyltransferase involved in cell wall biosynthesis